MGVVAGLYMCDVVKKVHVRYLISWWVLVVTSFTAPVRHDVCQQWVSCEKSVTSTMTSSVSKRRDRQSETGSRTGDSRHQWSRTVVVEWWAASIHSWPAAPSPRSPPLNTRLINTQIRNYLRWNFEMKFWGVPIGPRWLDHSWNLDI